MKKINKKMKNTLSECIKNIAKLAKHMTYQEFMKSCEDEKPKPIEPMCIYIYD